MAAACLLIVAFVLWSGLRGVARPPYRRRGSIAASVRTASGAGRTSGALLSGGGSRRPGRRGGDACEHLLEGLQVSGAEVCREVAVKCLDPGIGPLEDVASLLGQVDLDERAVH